jgi:hypothetical protein
MLIPDKENNLLILRINNHGKSTLRRRSYFGNNLGHWIFWICRRRDYPRFTSYRYRFVSAEIYPQGSLIPIVH